MWTVVRRMVAVGVVALAGLAIACSSGAEPGTGVLDDWRPEVGEPAPDFALVDVRDGETVRRLSDYRGKVVVLNWYASWCGPCWAEIPEFEAAHQALGDRLVVLGLNLQEDRPEAIEVIEGTGATYPMLLDAAGDVARHYRVPGLPSTYFIDEEGIVRSMGAGRILPETLEAELAGLGLDYMHAGADSP